MANQLKLFIFQNKLKKTYFISAKIMKMVNSCGLNLCYKRENIFLLLPKSTHGNLMFIPYQGQNCTSSESTVSQFVNSPRAKHCDTRQSE